jgi:hypothetical protein
MKEKAASDCQRRLKQSLTVDDGVVTKETSPRALDTLVLDKRSGVLPVLETVSLVVGTATGRDDDTKDDEGNNGDDLDRGEPEFTLAKDTRAHKVDDANERKADGNPKCVRVLSCPEIDKNSRGDKLDGENDDPVVPVVPAHGESQGLVDEALSQLDVATGNGEISHHLTERDHDQEANETDSAVTEEETERATVAEGTTGTEEETCTDDTADGNHGNVSRLEATLEALRGRLDALSVGARVLIGGSQHLGSGVVIIIDLLLVVGRHDEEGGGEDEPEEWEVRSLIPVLITCDLAQTGASTLSCPGSLARPGPLTVAALGSPARVAQSLATFSLTPRMVPDKRRTLVSAIPGFRRFRQSTSKAAQQRTLACSEISI